MDFIAVAFRDGGPVMYIIATVSVFSLAIMMERIYQLYIRFPINAPNFVAQISRFIRGGQIKKAISLCDAASSAILARIIKAALNKAGQDERVIQGMVDEEALDLLPKVQKRIDYLQVIANVSTLLGLLGTVFGIILVFKALADVDPAMKQQVLMRGISIKLYNTAFGLVVAIPSLLAHAILKAKAVRIVDEIDEYSVKVINILGEMKKQGTLPVAQTANPTSGQAS